MYDLAMTIYFGMYGATMTTNSELFWGPDSIMMLPLPVQITPPRIIDAPIDLRTGRT